MYRIYVLVIGVPLLCAGLMLGACFSSDLDPGPFAIAWNYDTSGFLETCGCSSNQLGGLAHRANVIRELRAKQPVLAIEGAHIMEDGGEYQLFKGEIIVRSLNEMDYSAMLLGAREAQQGRDGIEHLAGLAKFPCICANLELDGKPWRTRQAVLDIAGINAGITGVTQPEMVSFELPEGVGFSDPLTGAEDALEELDNAGADLVIVCLEGDSSWIANMMDRLRDRVDLFLTGDRKPATAGLEYAGDPPRINNWKFGKYVGVILVDPLADGYMLSGLTMEVRDDSPADEGIVDILDNVYRAQLKERFFSQLKVDLEQLYLPPETCQPCHNEAYENYMATGHSHAMNTLHEKGQLYNPDCMPCHVVYDPQQDQLASMNCVMCHSNIVEQHIWDAVEGKVERPDEPVATYTYQWCSQCHTEEQSHRFKEHWPQMVRQIFHGGDLEPARQAADRLGIDIEAEPPGH